MCRATVRYVQYDFARKPLSVLFHCRGSARYAHGFGLRASCELILLIGSKTHKQTISRVQMRSSRHDYKFDVGVCHLSGVCYRYLKYVPVVINITSFHDTNFVSRLFLVVSDKASELKFDQSLTLLTISICAKSTSKLLQVSLSNSTMSLIKFSSVAVLLLFLALLGNNGFNNNGIAVATKRPHPDKMISWRDHRHIKRTAISERDAFYYGEMAHLHALLRTSRAETAAANAALEAALAPILAIPDQANEAAETQVHPVANEVADNEEIVEQVVNPPAAIDHVNFAPDQANEEADVNPVPNEVAENNEQVVNPPADPVANEVAAIAANDNHVAHPAVPGANEEIDAPIIQGQADPVANEVATHPPIAAANQETDAPIIPGQADLAANEVAAIPGQEEPTPILEADQVAAVELVPDPLPAHVNPDNEVAAIPGQAEPAPILEADQVEAPELVHVNPDLHANGKLQ